MKGINFRISQSNVLWLLVIISVVGCGGGKSGGNNLGITGYTFEDVEGGLAGDQALLNDRYIAAWPGFEILPGGGTRRMNLQMPATVDGFAVDPQATLIDVNASGQFLAELFLPDSLEYSEVAALLSEGEPIILPFPAGYRQRNTGQIQPNILNARSLNNASKALVSYGGTESGLYFVGPNSIELAQNFGILSAEGQFFGNDFVAPFRFINGNRERLFTPPDGLSATIWAVSEGGVVAGTIAPPGDFINTVSVFIWSAADGVKYIDVKNRWRRVIPQDVNDNGIVIGYFDSENPNDLGQRPFLILGSQFVELSSLKIEPPGTFLGRGEGINNNNQITQVTGVLQLGSPTR